MAYHSNETVGSIHIPYNWSYADATARLAATGFVAADVGKFARQLDNNTLWMLINHSPITWKQLNGGSSDTSAIHVDVANEISGITEKTTLANADIVVIEDSAASYVKKKAQIINVRPVFGTYAQYAASDGETTYTGTVNWQTKTTLTTPSLPAGTYRVSFMAEIRNTTSVSDDIKYRLRQDATTDLCYGNIEVKDVTNYFPVTGFAHVTLTATTHAFTIEYALENAADTMAIRNARIEFWRIS